MKSYEQYLRDSALTKAVVNDFLDSSKLRWAQFDPEVGYTLGNFLPRDGLDNCRTISTAQANGARTARMYTDKPCRINTYGNSFTQCHQVSDGETWQEYLAAHLGEPIRNFGMGGFGFYQAYRRMRRTEQTNLGAKYILLYNFGDDHQRSVMRCRHAVTYPYWNCNAGRPLHGNFWANLEIDPRAGRFVEKENLLATPESLFKMCDPDFMVAALQDDAMVQLYGLAGGIVDPTGFDFTQINAVAKILGVAGIATENHARIMEGVWRIRHAYGFAASKFTVEKAVEFCRSHGKELLIILLCPNATRQLLNGEPRYDQEIADWLDEKHLKYFDMNRGHLADYKNFNLTVEDYLKRYFIGHYSPAGNHFFAFSLKSIVVDWLDPKPLTYREDGGEIMDFKGYLQ
jgi:hypothetical protein